MYLSHNMLKATSDLVFLNLVCQPEDFTYGRFTTQHVLRNKDNLHARHQDRYRVPDDSLPSVHRWDDDTGAY